MQIVLSWFGFSAGKLFVSSFYLHWNKGQPHLYHQRRVVPPAQGWTTSVGVDLESNCLYLQHRELIQKATICTSSVGMA